MNETKTEENSLVSVLGERYGFLMAVLNEDVLLQRKICTSLGVLSEALVDEINEIAADILGDILIEDDGDGFRIIDEYKELITGGVSNE